LAQVLVPELVPELIMHASRPIVSSALC